MAEESSTRASISRIVMLAEALFEVSTFSHIYCLLPELIQFSFPLLFFLHCLNPIHLKV